MPATIVQGKKLSMVEANICRTRLLGTTLT
jgi:hypothetical protein